MGSFCGFLGKGNEENLDGMIATIKHTTSYETTHFSDGFFYLGYVPFAEEDGYKVGHNASFTIWAMIDAGCVGEEFTAARIISAYEKNGISFVKGLQGTFSIVLWDGMKKELYLIRDRYGAKPLFYAESEDGIVFSTEINAILKHPCVKREMNKAAIYQYLSYQSVLLPHTAYMGINHVPAGFYDIYTDGKLKEVNYCSMLFGERVDDSYEEAVDKLHTMLKESVSQYMNDDKMGVFLSGGLDSSLITALAKDGRLKYAFCLEPATCKDSLHNKQEDVLFSKQLAKTYGLESYVWQMKAEDLIESVDEVIAAFGQPFSGTMSTYFLAKKSREICNNVLTGDGADELFGGYRHQTVQLPLQKYIIMKEKGENPFGQEKEFAPYDRDIQFLESLYQYTRGNDTCVRYQLLLMTDEAKGLFLNTELFGSFSEKKSTMEEIFRQDKTLKSEGVLNRSLERDFKYLLPGHTMLYVDTLGRSQGIQIRTPFLNNALTDYVVTLPQEYKMREGQPKAILKSVGNKVLPKEIVYRRKEPFSLPITEWMRGDLKEYVTDVLCMESVKRNGLLNPMGTEYALREFYKNPNQKAYYGQMLWAMVMLERWAWLYM